MQLASDDHSAHSGPSGTVSQIDDTQESTQDGTSSGLPAQSRARLKMRMHAPRLDSMTVPHPPTTKVMTLSNGVRTVTRTLRFALNSLLPKSLALVIAARCDDASRKPPFG